MREFSIRVGNTYNVSEHTQCAYHAEVVEAGGSITLDCNAVGRFVSFRREGGDEFQWNGIDYTGQIGLVTICEFVVIGHPLRSDGERFIPFNFLTVG